MTPKDANAHDQAIEALIAASLRERDKEIELTDEEISRYVDQRVTLSSEDEAALDKSKEGVIREIAGILRGTEPEKADCANSKPTAANPEQSAPSKQSRPREEFVEAVVIAQLTRLLASPEYPLGRFRYNKFAYFSHRKAEEDVSQHYMKKAAGPYSPWARYQGPESIALKSGYVKRGKAGSREGLLPGEKIENIDQYLPRYPVCAAIDWVVSTFRYTKKDELELLATVDFAALDLKSAGIPITTEAVTCVIAANKEWTAKLDREVFSGSNIEQALHRLRALFPSTYETIR